ncbi:MAG: carboxypeptidase-like regulatory domain-containing protein, partial [Planctomycetes bacterium]|nr:carboxypeptidase-like regulatory domain-containing protein [Planctomycetota bacterium]
MMGAGGGPAKDATVHFSRENGPEGGEEGLPLAQPVDPQGRYSTDVLAGGQFEVWAEGGGQGTERARVHSFPGSRHEVDFWLPGALTIEAVLRDPSGNPVSGGKTWAWRDHGPATRWGPSQWRPDAFFGTDSDKGGRYRISVSSPGTYLLAGIALGFASSLPVEVSVGENTPHAKVDLELFEGATISGVVRKEDGEPIAGINLQAAMEARSDFFARVRGRTASAGVLGGGECRTRDDGSFEWRSLHPMGTYTIRRYPGSFPSTGWDYWPILRGVRAGTRGLEIVLPGDRPRTCLVTGIVLGPGDASPPREFSVSLDHDHGDDTWSAVEHHSSRGRTDGRFSLERVIPGERYSLRAYGVSPERGFAWIGPWIARPEGNEFTIRLRPHGSLECRVVDGAGRPVPFAEVDGEPFPAYSMAQGVRPDRTDETGTVRFKGVEPNGYRIRAWKGTRSSEPVEVEVPEGESM